MLFILVDRIQLAHIYRDIYTVHVAYLKMLSVAKSGTSHSRKSVSAMCAF